MKKGFTLFEILLVILIIAILVTLAVPTYNKARESAYDNQAKADLKLISMAEKGYHIDMGDFYYPTTSDQPAAILELNNNLKLNLPAASNRNWNYMTKLSGGTNCCVEATSNSGTTRYWYMLVDSADASSGTCPP